MADSRDAMEQCLYDALLNSLSDQDATQSTANNGTQIAPPAQAPEGINNLRDPASTTSGNYQYPQHPTLTGDGSPPVLTPTRAAIRPVGQVGPIRTKPRKARANLVDVTIYPGDTEEEIKRKLNTMSARTSREKSKMALDMAENRVLELEQENAWLRYQLQQQQQQHQHQQYAPPPFPQPPYQLQSLQPLPQSQYLPVAPPMEDQRPFTAPAPAALFGPECTKFYDNNHDANKAQAPATLPSDSRTQFPGPAIQDGDKNNNNTATENGNNPIDVDAGDVTPTPSVAPAADTNGTNVTATEAEIDTFNGDMDYNFNDLNDTEALFPNAEAEKLAAPEIAPVDFNPPVDFIAPVDFTPPVNFTAPIDFTALADVSDIYNFDHFAADAGVEDFAASYFLNN